MSERKLPRNCGPWRCRGTICAERAPKQAALWQLQGKRQGLQTPLLLEKVCSLKPLGSSSSHGASAFVSMI